MNYVHITHNINVCMWKKEREKENEWKKEWERNWMREREREWIKERERK